MENNTKNFVAKKCKEDKNVICYNCNKKDYYTNKYLEPKKPKNCSSLGYLDVGND